MRAVLFILYTRVFFKDQWLLLSGGVHFLLAQPFFQYCDSHFPIVLPALDTCWGIGLWPSFSRWGSMSSRWDIIIIPIPRPVRLLSWSSWEFLHTSLPSQPETFLDFMSTNLLVLSYCHHQVPEKLMVIFCAVWWWPWKTQGWPERARFYPSSLSGWRWSASYLTLTLNSSSFFVVEV